jgi:hypothetical protein
MISHLKMNCYLWLFATTTQNVVEKPFAQFLNQVKLRFK